MPVPSGSGTMDIRAGLVADRLGSASTYPWFAANQLATCAIEIAVAEGGSANAATVDEWSVGYCTYSLDGDPQAGATIEVVVNDVVMVKHYLTQKGERSMPLAFTFPKGVTKCYVRIANEGTTNKKSLCLHNVRKNNK